MKTNQEKIAEISARIELIIECCATTANNFAKILGYNRAQTIYDIINKKCAPSYDFFNRFADTEYSAIINLRWLLNGEGEMWTDFFRRLEHDIQVEVVSDVNNGVSISHHQMLNNAENALMEFALSEKATSQKEFNSQTNKLLRLTKENAQLKERITHSEKYYDTMMQQAEEIGRLKERIAQLEREKGKDVSDARTSGVANVG